MVEKKHILVKTHDPDLERFAELVIAAKGARSMRAFAQDCGLNPATFTRITKKINTGSSRPKLIEAIAANADPNSGVTLDLLADANGYSRQEVHTFSERVIHHPRPASSMAPTSKLMTQTIVIQALARKNLDLRIRPGKYLSTAYPCIQPDLLIDVTSREEDRELLFVEYIPPYLFSFQKVLDRLGRYTLTDAYKSEHLPPVTFLMVVSESEMYDKTMEVLSSKRVPISLSIILIDFDESRIKKQHVFTRKSVDWVATKYPINFNLLYED